ncbi:MAG: hypothetical protein DI601_21230 [Azospirillum brasilense]|nr:MAG: hypothetical protein DI601_21230 [Azospirillum brasilense]
MNERLLTQHRDLLMRALQAVVLNTVYIETNPEAGVRAAWEVIGAPANRAAELPATVHVVRRAAELWKHSTEPMPWGAMNDQSWTGILDYLGNAADIALQDLNLGTLYTNALTEEVNRVQIDTAIAAARQA